MIKIFEKGYKINFVDSNNVLVGYDNEKDCCEQFGWVLSFTEQACKGQSEVDDFDLSEYVFDTEFFKEYGDDPEEGRSVVFRMEHLNPPLRKKSKKSLDLYLHLHNSHNGYYSHGFKMSKVKGKTIYEGSL